jgi:hypothetical protein
MWNQLHCCHILETKPLSLQNKALTSLRRGIIHKVAANLNYPIIQHQSHTIKTGIKLITLHIFFSDQRHKMDKTIIQT